MKVIEAGVVAMVSALLAFILMVGVDDCTATKPFGNNTVTARVYIITEWWLLIQNVYVSLSVAYLMTVVFLEWPEDCSRKVILGNKKKHRRFIKDLLGSHIEDQERFSFHLVLSINFLST